jgi:hypothetical protein
MLSQTIDIALDHGIVQHRRTLLDADGRVLAQRDFLPLAQLEQALPLDLREQNQDYQTQD